MKTLRVAETLQDVQSAGCYGLTMLESGHIEKSWEIMLELKDGISLFTGPERPLEKRLQS